MSVLLDTCVLSELVRQRPNEQVLSAVGELDPAATYLSVITVGEFHKGIAGIGPGARREGLQRWVATVEREYGRRLLPVDLKVARRWGKLNGLLRGRGRAIPLLDGLLAATAMEHDLVIMTRNVADFADTGVEIVNPW